MGSSYWAGTTGCRAERVSLPVKMVRPVTSVASTNVSVPAAARLSRATASSPFSSRRADPLEDGELRVAGEAHVHVAAPGVGVRPAADAHPHVVEGYVLDRAVRRAPQDHPVLAFHPQAGGGHGAGHPPPLDPRRGEGRPHEGG